MPRPHAVKSAMLFLLSLFVNSLLNGNVSVHFVTLFEKYCTVVVK